MSHDPQSPSDRLDREPDDALVCECEWCGEIIDQMDVDVEAFEVMGGPCCVSCRRGWDET